MQIKALGLAAKLLDTNVGDITLLGSDEKVVWTQAADALTIKVPPIKNGIAIVYKISF